MANFLDDLSIYNAKAAAAISLAVTQGDSPKANLMSSLKTTANDITLSDAVRLNSLTALINVGSLLDVPLPPYFPVVSTFANSQTYVGVHNDLSGLNVGDYQHLTAVEKAAALNKASLSDISFANLIGAYTDNASLVAGFATKQNALSGTGYVKASGGTITYDNSTFLTAVTGIVAADTPGGGQLTGTYASPVLSNAAVIAKVLTGFNPSAPTGVISSTDSIISAIQKLNANVNSLAASGGTINEITFSLPSSVFSYTAGPFTSGAVPLSGTFVNQSQNRFFAGPSSGGSGQPTFRAIVPGDFPASGATAGTYGSSSSIPVVQVDAYGRVTNISSVASASGGQVNTITYSVPAGVFTSTVTGTTAVGITLGLSTQTANTVWAGPASGAAATPGFRSLVAADIPNIAISQVTSLQSELDSKMNYLLNAGEIWIGNASNAPTNKSLTGDVTMTINGVVTIENEAVTFAKMQNITSGNLLGRWDASTPGDIQQISLSADFDLDPGTGILSLAVPVAPILNSKGGLITYRQSIGQQVQLTAVFDGNLLITDSAEDDGLKWVTAQGDIEVDGALDGTFNITPGAVTLAKMANLAANSFIGNNTGSSATPIALTTAQATAMLNQFTTSAKGLVPAASFTPAPGKTLADYFLNANGGWSLGGSGGGGTTTYPLTIGTGLSGTSATFDGSAAVTVSLNTSNANTWNALQTFHNNIYLGEASGAAGSARFLGSTSGYVVLQAAASPANQIYTLPTAYPASSTGYYLTATTGGVMSWATITGGGTVTTVSVVSANGFAGTVANATTTPAITLTTSVTGLLKGNGTAISAATAGTDYLTSIGLTMPSAFTVTPATLTANGTFAVTAAGTAAQYVRGDGQLALLPTSGGGGTSVSYYLNGSVNQGTIGGNVYYQMSKTPVNGPGSNFTLTNTTGYIAEFLTDANDPSLLSIPAGAWDINLFLSSSNATGTPSFYAELYKYDGSTFTLIATGSGSPEIITNGTAIDYYQTSLAVPLTTLTATDRLAIRVFVNTNGNRTITLHTEDSHLCQIVTTFAAGITSLNGLNASTQFFATGTSGTAPAFVSSTATHTLNIPLASASSVTAGLISNAQYNTFNGKLANVLTTTGDIIYSSSGTTAARLGIGTTGQVLSVVGGIPAWSSAGAGNVVGPASSTTGNFAVYADTTGLLLANPSVATLSSTGRATFNDGVNIGVAASAATGTLVFTNGTTSATTTFQSSTSQSANLNYTWPQSAPTAGQVLSSDASGNLSWTATGTGNVTLAGTNAFTGANSFASTVTIGNAGTFTLTTPAGTGVMRLVSSTATAGVLTATFPDASGIVAMRDVSQTFSLAQSFSGTLTVTQGGVLKVVSSGTTGTVSLVSGASQANNVTATFPDASGIVAMRNVSQTFSLAQSFSGAVTINQGASFKIVSTGTTGTVTLLSNASQANNVTATFPDATGTLPLLSLAQTFSALQTFSAGLTVSAGTTTISGAATFSGGATFQTTVSTFNSGILRIGNASNTFFYTIVGSAITAGRQLNLPLIATTDTFAVLGIAQTFTAAQTFSGGLVMSSAITGAASQDVFNTTSTTINFAGAATTLTIGNTATAAQTVNMFTASTGASTYNFATGATASATTKAINIGTGGAAGSTTNITFGTSATTNLRFFGSANTSGKPTVTGSRGGNAALASFLTAMSNLGLITDSTTA